MSFSIRKFLGRDASGSGVPPKGDTLRAQQLVDRGLAAENANAAGDALECYRSAVAADPQFAPAHMNLGIALQAGGDLPRAIASYRRSIALDPGYAAAHYNLGLARLIGGDFSQAEEDFRAALRFRANFPEAWVGLADVLEALGRVSQARSSYARALELRPDYHEAHSNLIFTLDLLEECTIGEQQAERRRWYQRHGQRHAGAIRAHDNAPDPERRLRVGYVSADFRRHSASYIFSPIICHHDRSAFEIFCYSDVKLEDDVTARLRQAAQQWRPTLRVPDEAVAEQIRRDCIDILVDLSGHSAGNRLPVFARKPAPVQITAWGHANGTGLETMDYFLADPVAVPQQERRHFAEEVVDLPCIVCYEPPEYLPEVSVLPALEAKAITFGCVNRIEKISGRAMTLWGRILAAQPEARLLIKGAGLDDLAHRQQFLRRLRNAGIGVERVRLIGTSPHAAHLKIYHEVDLGLDPFPHGGGISTAEALWMGVPVVTLNGPTVPNRVAASIMASLGMPEWIAQSEEEYVRIALDAARDLPGLVRLRARLRARLAASALGDVRRYTGEVEAAYRTMWRRWCADNGNAPAGDRGRAQQLVDRGIAVENSGAAAQALQCYREAIAADPGFAPAHMNLGIALLATHELSGAVASYQRALALDPCYAAAHYNLGMARLDLRQHAQAENDFRAALRFRAEFPEAWVGLADALEALGRDGEALAALDNAIGQREHYVGALLNASALLQKMGRLPEAEANHRRILELAPDYHEAHNNLGNLLQTLGRVSDATVCYQRALELKPDYGEARRNLLDLLEDCRIGDLVFTLDLLEERRIARRQEEPRGEYTPKRQVSASDRRRARALVDRGIAAENSGAAAQALQCFREASTTDPRFAPAHMNLGIALQAGGDLPSAIESYQSAISLDPGYPAAHYNLAMARLGAGEHALAEDDFRVALNLRPEFPEAWVGLADALEALGSNDDALAALDNAVEQRQNYFGALLNASLILRKMGRQEEAQAKLSTIPEDHPDFPSALFASAIMLPDQGHADVAEARFRRALKLRPDYHEGYSNLLFVLNYHPDRSAEEIFSAYRDFDERFCLPLRAEWSPHLNDRLPARRLRVGYVSPDFCKHPCRHFIEPLLDHHDKSVVEVFAYAQVRVEDAVTARMKERVDHWVPTTGMSDAKLADRIRTDRIDILVDLAGHTHGNRLLVFARRPAPVSVTHLQGFGYSTGLSAIDWCLADALVAPEGSEHLFAERPWRISQCMVYRPAEGMGLVGSLPAERHGHVTFGTLTRPVRINHRTIRVWAEIMCRVPGSRLRMDSGAFRDAGLRRNLAEKFSARGVAEERLEMGFHSPPWDVLREIDIGLDCFPHNSATTLFESLYMGVPFVTLPERPSVGRLGASILTSAGQPEWIAASEHDYVLKAVALAADLPRLSEIRQRLRAELQASALMDEAGYVRVVEAAYREMWRNWCSAGRSALQECKR